MIKRFVIALVLVVLVCGGLVGFNLFRAKMIADFFANQQMPAVTVSATRVEPITWTPQIEAIGTLWANQGVSVASEASGVVKSIEFHANDRVEQGQLLVQIDDAVERADLLSARAAVERDQAALERARTLSRSGVSSTAALQEAETNLAASESTLNRIQATIDLKSIEAPFGGVIGIPRVDVGEYVQPGTVIATLQQLDTMHVDFTVPEQQMDQVKLGQSIRFGLTANEFPFEGRIIGIDPRIDPQTRLVSVRARADNPSGELRPGQFARVRVDLPPVPEVIALPQTSVVTSLYGDYVYVVQEREPQPAEAAQESDGAQAGQQPPQEQLVAKQVFVEIGNRQGNLVQVLRGVEPGQTVVTSGQNKLANNTPVTINNAIDPAAVALGEGNGRT